MMRKGWERRAVQWILLLTLVRCGATQQEQEAVPTPAIYTPSVSYATPDSPFEPLPPQVGGGPAADLGEKLYSDRIMSVDGTLTCFSCHDVHKGGTDGLPKPHVSSRETGQINTGIINALEECGGNQTKAASMLGMSRRTLVSRLDAYELPRPRKPTS